MQTLDKVFHLQDAHTTVKRELIAALTTFVSLSYILFVNPNILHAAGIPKGAAFTVTAVATAIGCFLMGFIANYPIALAPTLGSGAFFAYRFHFPSILLRFSTLISTAVSTSSIPSNSSETYPS